MPSFFLGGGKEDPIVLLMGLTRPVGMRVMLPTEVKHTDPYPKKGLCDKGTTAQSPDFGQKSVPSKLALCWWEVSTDGESSRSDLGERSLVDIMLGDSDGDQGRRLGELRFQKYPEPEGFFRTVLILLPLFRCHTGM